MFGSRRMKQADDSFYRELRGELERRERNADASIRDAKKREEKWTRVIQRMTGRGEDHEGRDVAIRNRDKARADKRAAEIELLNAKNERSNYRG